MNSKALWGTVSLAVLLFSILILGDVRLVQAKPAALGAIDGKLLSASGEPTNDAVVLFFNTTTGPPPAPEQYWRLPTDAGPVDENGHFFVELPAGRYWIGAIKKPTGNKNTQPTFDDWLYLGRNKAGGLEEMVVKAGKTTHLKDIQGARPLKPRKNMPSAMIKVNGAIKDQNARPLPGFVVEAFGSPTEREQPMFSSDQAREDGHYDIALPPGTYYLKIRAPVASRGQSGDLKDIPPDKFQLPEPVELVVTSGKDIRSIDWKIKVKSKIKPAGRGK